ncbi:hypothetical protein H6P81_011655 [Aristolochia fimbriata]|uniref:Uncharacterized protein n=1 Tax=Aristolochia fimbriata TaxID=158543 RepID=A0AAV7EDC3_ARIFI|nr:hypothetical protein H6P81_011655 [Aristolochia fimbriata]
MGKAAAAAHLLQVPRPVVLVVLALFLMICCLGVVVRGMELDDKDLESEERLWDLYQRWRSHHTVTRDLAEKKDRFEAFKKNVMYIHSFNKKDAPYKLKLNKFGDMTNEEFRKYYAGYINSRRRKVIISSDVEEGRLFMYDDKVTEVPTSVDWRAKGAVTAIKDQGQCGSCWAFSTVVGVEGINAIKTKKLISLSEQQLVDCDNTQNQGCNGGWMELAFDYIQKNGGITTESNYPYTASDGRCIKSKEKSHVVSIDGHQTVPPNDEAALLKAAANQPISVAIDAGGEDFQFYSEGVFAGACGTDLDHGVAVVGYGATTDRTKYWIVKNSWGTEWGEKGYIRMQRDVPAKEGLCGIAMEASYPIKTSPNNDPPAKHHLEEAPPKEEL